jgi:hypothetical protein
VIAIAGLGALGGFYALLAALGGFEATTAAVVLVEVIFGVGLALSQMRPIFVARRLRKKLAAGGLPAALVGSVEVRGRSAQRLSELGAWHVKACTPAPA